MARTILPMISSADPFLSGHLALVNPNDILNTDYNNSYPFSYEDDSCNSKNQQLSYGELSFTSENLDDIIDNFNEDACFLNLNGLEDFVDSFQNEFPDVLNSNEICGSNLLIQQESFNVIYPESPVSLDDDFMNVPEYQTESFEIISDGTESLFESSSSSQICEESFETIEPSYETPIQSPATVESEKSDEPEIYRARSGRVIKRKLYDDDDEDYEPVIKTVKKRSNTTKKVSKPRVRIYDDETKRQNMIAARRYREKKRSQQTSLDDIFDEEMEKNTKLNKQIEQFQSEISILKELLASVLKPHRIVHLPASN